MRLRLTLIARQLCYLPLNYQGLLSAAIYKKLGQADPVLAQWLHQKGYGQDGKLFKLFCFSPLTGMPYRIHKEAEAIEFPQGKVEWQVAFYVDAILQQFIIGLFKNQHLGLGNERFKPVDFDITQVEVLPEPTWQDTMTYTCMSPVIVSEGELNKEYAQYRSPDDLNYEKLIQNNLHQRLRAILSVPIQTQELPFKIRIMSQYTRIHRTANPSYWVHL